MTHASDADASKLELFAWLSPGFPVGSFAYSHGLETAAAERQVTDAASLLGWLSDLLARGSARTDAILAGAAWSAAAVADHAGFAEVNDLALALSASRERHLETAAQGNAFVAVIRAAWPTAAFPGWPDGDIAYPAAFGSACGVAGIDRLDSLRAFALAFAQNLVSAALRLGAIGQTDGQRVMAALLPAVRALAREASQSSVDDVGGCAQRSDIAAMQHETLYSRLFRS